MRLRMLEVPSQGATAHSWARMDYRYAGRCRPPQPPGQPGEAGRAESLVSSSACLQQPGQLQRRQDQRHGQVTPLGGIDLKEKTLKSGVSKGAQIQRGFSEIELMFILSNFLL